MEGPRIETRRDAVLGEAVLGEAVLGAAVLGAAVLGESRKERNILCRVARFGAEPQEIKFPIGYLSSVGFLNHDCPDIIMLFLFYPRTKHRVLLFYEFRTNGIGKFF